MLRHKIVRHVQVLLCHGFVETSAPVNLILNFVPMSRLSCARYMTSQQYTYVKLLLLFLITKVLQT